MHETSRERTGRRARVLLGVALAAVLALLLAAPARAGGWAAVTLDALPREVRAGQALTLGFMVRQHGITPIDGAFGEGTMQPFLTAINAQTGARYEAPARKEGPVGHFVVDVAFPAAGTWSWAITPPPFESTRLGTLTVLPVSGAPQASNADHGLALPVRGAEAARAALRLTGGLLLAVAVGLWLRERRASPGRAAHQPAAGD